MVLSGKTRFLSTISNRSQGGGNKKAGFPYQVGRTMWSDVHLQSNALTNGRCCKLKNMQTLLFPLANQSRPIGRDNSAGYWNVHGTR